MQAFGGAVAAEAPYETSAAPNGAGRSVDYGLWLMWLTLVLGSIVAVRRGAAWTAPRPGVRWPTAAIAIS